MPSGPAALRAEIAKRFSVQLHMALILAACFGVGLGVTKLLLMAGVGAMWVRYSVALVFAYAAFLAGIRLWLAYAGYGASVGDSVRDALSNVTTGGSSNSGWSGVGGGGRGGGALPGFRGGGGRYGGGGASGSFADAGSAGTAARSAPLLSAISSTSDSHARGNGGNGQGGTHGGWDAEVGDVDDGGWVLIAVIALIAGAFGAAIYLVYMAPIIMSDAAFAALLSGGLVRSARRISVGGWVGSAVRDSWKPFAIVIVLAVVFALVAQHFYPGARTLADVYARF